MPATSDILLKLILAVVIGGAIGAEREYSVKSAGFRTLTLICLGATIFTIFSQYIGGPGNPDRIASNIVTGIGFVGAGGVFKGDGTSKVNGTPPAAMIWVTAALGVAIGAGCLWIAAISCGLILLVLFIFSLLEGRIDRINQIRNYKITCPFQNETLHRFEVLFTSHHLKFRSTRQSKSSDTISGEWVVQGSEQNHRH